MFKDDLKKGEKVERFVVEQLKIKYPSTYKIEGYCKEYDILIPEIDSSVEVKNDKQLDVSSKNFFIEVECENKPSGLSSTGATWWWIISISRQIVIAPKYLRHLIQELNLELRTFTPKDTTVKGYLCPIKNILNYNQIIINQGTNAIRS